MRAVHRSIRSSYLVAILFLLLPSAAFAAAAPERIKISTASITASTLPLWIADEQGIFKKYGIEAHAVLIRGGPTMLASLVAGDTPMAFTTGVPFLGAVAQGNQFKMLSCISDKNTWKLIAQPDIKKADDLRGKSIGVQTIVGSTWMNSMLALEVLGLEPKRDRINFVPTGDPITMGKAIEAHRIDAAVLDPTTSRHLVGKGFSLLVDLFKANVYFPGLGIGLTRAYLDQHVPQVEKVVTALTESVAFVLQPANKPVVIKSMMKNLRMTDLAAIEEGYQDQILTLNRKPYPTLEGMRNAQRLMALQNPKIGSVKIEDIVDGRFVKKLDESGFIDSLYAAK
ncbi:MAG TPA: ABC transporter substrate-binding protein [Candidatus Binatia bacterium]|nr:ABC transporter substrate-binding protein [Candidatus Binatia bacterium]